MNIINIYDNYNSYFNADLKAIFEQCSKIAFDSGYKLYLIGGIVRDLLLNKSNLDIDITVEGNAIEFAKILEKEIKAKIISIHKDFGTTKVLINGQNIDFASTRCESYPKKGHLPQIEKINCSLEEDVLRRDFTINSLAISLNQDHFADLIDYVNGFTDLKSKKIRILHDKSFIDDPTRIIRALKYSTRLDFELEEKTFKLQEEYLKNINYDMSNKRIKQEFKKTFEQEQNRDIAFYKFIEQGIYKLITTKFEFARIRFGITLCKNIENLIIKYKPKHAWLIYLGIIAIDENLDKFELTKTESQSIESAKSLINTKLSTDFDIYKAFCTQKLETLLILTIFGHKNEVLHYLDNLQKIKLSITGEDLIKLGLEPSKQFGEIFDCLLIEKLKNPKLTKADELKIIKKLFINV